MQPRCFIPVVPAVLSMALQVIPAQHGKAIGDVGAAVRRTTASCGKVVWESFASIPGMGCPASRVHARQLTVWTLTVTRFPGRAGLHKAPFREWVCAPGLIDCVHWRAHSGMETHPTVPWDSLCLVRAEGLDE